MDKNNLFVGQSTTRIDSKNRLFIPSSIGTMKLDSYVIVFDEEMDCFKLYSVEEMKIELERLKELINNAKTVKEKRFHKNNFYTFCKSILKESKTDKQGRITLPQVYESGTELLVFGAGDHLVVEPKNKKKTLDNK